MTEPEKLPRWWPVATMLALVRAANAVDHLRHGRPVQAVKALRPTMLCTCTGWTECKAYYLKGYYQYCPSCGVYRAC